MTGEAGDPELVDEISSLFEERLQIRVSDPELDLMEEGLLDSLVFVDLLLALEQTYGIELRMDEIDFDDFRTTSRIAAWVAARR